jgi:hypothetical protein
MRGRRTMTATSDGTADRKLIERLKRRLDAAKTDEEIAAILDECERAQKRLQRVIAKSEQETESLRLLADVALELGCGETETIGQVFGRHTREQIDAAMTRVQLRNRLAGPAGARPDGRWVRRWTGCRRG